jgi:hypothetical protein
MSNANYHNFRDYKRRMKQQEMSREEWEVKQTLMEMVNDEIDDELNGDGLSADHSAMGYSTLLRSE